MFQPIDPIEQRKQALIQHLVSRAGMAGGGRPVGTLSGRAFGSFTRSGADPLMRILAQHGNEAFTGINPGQIAAAAAMANNPAMAQGPSLAGVTPPGLLAPAVHPAMQPALGHPAGPQPIFPSPTPAPAPAPAPQYGAAPPPPTFSGMPSISPGEFRTGGGAPPPPIVAQSFIPSFRPTTTSALDPYLQSALTMYGGRNGFGWG